MEYVIKEEPYNRGIKSQGYYTGLSYVVQGCKYLIFNPDIEEAKIYSSQKRAENAIKSINKWTCMYNLVVEEVKE